VVVALLPVLVAGLNEPQEVKGLHDQVTPELVGSFATTAVTVVVAPGFRDVGGAGLNITEMAAEPVMVTNAEAEAEAFCTAVAVMVTEPPVGIAAGAV
jgi:hypothetical protein